jgi:hypothetical protein
LFHSLWADLADTTAMKLYGELAGWYRLIDPPAEHAEEAEVYARLIREASPEASALLELGSGGGHNAVHLKRHFRCTLADLSEDMLAMSLALNPDCGHLAGDMRALRLGRTFDAVFVHDAVMYMTTREDLLAAARTAYAHTAPGGVALFVPDCTRETFRDEAHVEGVDEGERSVRYVMWTWDPDPDDDTCLADFAFLLREGKEMRAVHDRHVEGVFAEAVWIEILTRAGFEVEAIRDALPGEPGVVAFRGRRR